MPLLWEGKDALQFILFTIVLITILLSRRALLAAYCEGGDHFTPSISIGSITRGEKCSESL